MTDRAAARESLTARSPVILLVEDDVIVRFTTAEILRDGGFTVLEASDATEALAYIATGSALDLVISDVRMPGEIDGIGLAHRLKQLTPSLPVVIMSSHLPNGVAHPAEAFLSKPYRANQLLDLVTRMLPDKWKNDSEAPKSS